MTYVIERAILEFYTTFLREEDQSKYFIPMQFHVGGKVVQSRRKRWLVAAACLAGVLIAFAASGFEPARPGHRSADWKRGWVDLCLWGCLEGRSHRGL